MVKAGSARECAAPDPRGTSTVLRCWACGWSTKTLFTGLQLTSTTEIFMHFEAAAGGGLSDALGLAGFTDLDVVRNLR